jgi:SAM-dependent methyltransferase
MTDPRYASKDFDDTVEDEFYRSGISDAGYLMAFYDQFGKVPKFEANCLELGCGLGRIGFAIAPSFAQYTGVDISTSHLKIAASRQLKRSSHALTRQGKSLEFMELRKWIGDVEKKRYELFYSLLVLQHNPPPLSIYLLKLGLSQLAVGGVAVIQIPYFIEGYNFQENAYFQERRHLMEMHAIPQHMILDAAAEEACRTRLVMEDGRVGPMGRSATFVFEKYT